jgi:hypothetical protein
MQKVKTVLIATTLLIIAAGSAYSQEVHRFSIWWSDIPDGINLRSDFVDGSDWFQARHRLMDYYRARGINALVAREDQID